MIRRALIIVGLTGACFPLHAFKKSDGVTKPAGETRAIGVQLGASLITLLAGDRQVVPVVLTRPTGVDGEVTFELGALPAGVTAELPAIGAGETGGTLTLTGARPLLATPTSKLRVIARVAGAADGEASLDLRTSEIARVQTTPDALIGPRGAMLQLKVVVAQPEKLATPLRVEVSSPLAQIAPSGDVFFLTTTAAQGDATGDVTVAITHGDVALPPLLVPLQWQAVPGTLDVTFGENGRATATFSRDYVAVADAVLAPSGGAYFIATVNGQPPPPSPAPPGPHALVGYVNERGEITQLTSFGSPPGDSYDVYARTIALDAHGRILVATQARPLPPSYDTGGSVTVGRLLADGTPDPTFGVDGWRSIDVLPVDLASHYPCNVGGVFFAGDVIKLVLQATTDLCTNSTQQRLVVQDIDDGGTLGDSFAVDPDPGQPDAYFNVLYGAAAGKDGSVVGYGYGVRAGGEVPGWSARLSNLAPPAFDGGWGSLQIPAYGAAPPVDGDRVRGAFHLGGNEWLFAGYTDRDNVNSIYVARTGSAAGALSNGFGNNGRRVFRVADGSGAMHGAAAVADNQQRPIVFVDYFFDNLQRIALTRLTSGGDYDTTFQNGHLVLDTQGTHASASRLLRDNQGRAWAFSCSATNSNLDCVHPGPLVGDEKSAVTVHRLYIE